MKGICKNSYLFTILLVIQLNVTAATLYSRIDGVWSTMGTWSKIALGGATCNCTPTTGDVVIIGNGNIVTYNSAIYLGSSGYPKSVTINANSFLRNDTTGIVIPSIEVSNDAILNVAGTLRTNNLIFWDPDSHLNIQATGYVNVRGGFKNRNTDGSHVIDGNMTVAGFSFINDAGSSIVGLGGISITNSASALFLNSGTVFGCTGNTCCAGPPCTLGHFFLPIELLYFSAVIEAGHVKILWATASEINNDYFTVERSIDGRNFEELAKITGAGNISTETKYMTMDNKPLNETAYYLLKQTDFDGTSTYSDMIAVEHKNISQDFSIYPNPVNGHFYIAINRIFNERITVQIFNMIGKKIITKEILSSDPTIKINEPLGRGVYTVFFKSNDLLITKQLIVQ